MINLRKLRKENNLTMKKLGELFLVGESTVSMWETGKREPDIETLRKLAKYFNVTIDYLLTDKENNFNDKEGKEKMKKNTENNGLDIFEQIFKVAEQRRPGFMSELLTNLQQDGGMESILDEVAQDTQKIKFPTLLLAPKAQYATIEDMEKFKNEILEAIKTSKTNNEYGKEKSLSNKGTGTAKNTLDYVNTIPLNKDEDDDQNL